MAGRHRAPRPTSALLRRSMVVLALVALAVVAVVLAIGPKGAPSASAASSSTSTAVPSGATAMGPQGVEARWVIQENAKAGTRAWKIPVSNHQNVIAGFANHDYAKVGQRVTFYVTTPSPTFSVVAYRMGYYQGLGARQIWASTTLPGIKQAACRYTSGINEVSCANWTPSFTITLTSNFVQGDYLFKLIASTGQEDYVPLTIWQPGSKAAYLVINRTFVEQGWNYWGGYDFYQGLGGCVPTYPVCNRARVVSLDRPYNTGNGASDYFGSEYPLIRYAEEHGLDVTYVTDTTLDATPAAASGHKAILSLGHDETWSTPERQGVEAAYNKGTNIAFFGAAAVLRHVRMEPSALGPERTEVDYRNSAEDPLNGHGNPLYVTGNTFSNPPTSWTEIPLVGEIYAGFLTGANNMPFVVSDASSWIMKGTGLHNGSKLGGVISSDIDHLYLGGGSDPKSDVVGHSPVPLNLAYTNQGSWNGVTYSDFVYHVNAKSHAGIIDTGTVNWIWAMSSCVAKRPTCPDNNVQMITGNILKVFGAGPAGLIQPVIANATRIQPSGS